MLSHTNCLLLACFAVTSANEQTEFALLGTPPSPTESEFGKAVDIDGDLALIGAPRDQGYLGSAYSFDTRTKERVHHFTASDGEPGDDFGYSVALGDAVVLIGARGDRDQGPYTGSAYLFDRVSGAQLAKLTASDAFEDAVFGHSVAVSGQLAVVGAPNFDWPSTVPGAVYVFDLGTQTEVAKLVASDGHAGNRFGFSVAIEGNEILVGAPNQDPCGAVYRFDATTFAELAKWTCPPTSAGPQFGYSVDTHRGRAVVGQPFAGSSPGAAHLFDVATGAALALLEEPNPSGYLYHRYFGVSVSIGGDTIAVGQPLSDVFFLEAGSAWLFDAATGALRARLDARIADSQDEFARAVATDGHLTIVGAPESDSPGASSGAAHLYCSDCVGTTYCSSNVNSTGLAARILACGDTRLGSSDFRLMATSMPQNEEYLFYFGTAQAQQPFGNGIRCVGGTTRRIGSPGLVHRWNADRILDLTSAGITAPGTLYFQCWFRDSAGGGAGFDLTDALEVNFLP